MGTRTGRKSRLCYLDAARVKGPLGKLGGLKLETPSHEELGTLDGVLIDPLARRVRFYVVEKTGWLRSQKYLIPTDCLVQMSRDRDALRVDLEDDNLPTFDSVRGEVRQFSDEDLVDAIFAPEAA